MGRVAIVDTKTGQVEIFDASKDCLRLMRRILETGAVYSPTTPRELIDKLNGTATKNPAIPDGV